MARVRKFDEPGAKEDRIRWNKSGTRKWLTVYTVMEYRPTAKGNASGDATSEPKKAKPKRAKKASKPKKTAKPKEASKPKTAKPKT